MRGISPRIFFAFEQMNYVVTFVCKRADSQVATSSVTLDTTRCGTLYSGDSYLEYVCTRMRSCILWTSRRGSNVV